MKAMHTVEREAPVSLPSARTTAGAIAEAIRRDILAGRYVSGEKLRQVEVASRYQVSTTPVREAFGILQRQGLVQVHPQRGATAIVPNVRDLEELYEIRIELECLATEHAVANFQDSDAEPLRAILEEMRVSRDPARVMELNHTFHMSLYRFSERDRLVQMIEQLRLASQAYMQMITDDLVPAGNAEHEHDEILAAFEAKDPVAARIATKDHLQQTVANVVAQLAESANRTDRESLLSSS